MAHPLDAAVADPWGALRLVMGEPLHPGGADATEALLDRAAVGSGTRLLDVGCGGGQALNIARERGARPVGLDRQTSNREMIKGDFAALPVSTSSVDVVLAECVLCLADDIDQAATETARALAPKGRLALSDVVVSPACPDLPAPIERALCLETPRSRERLRSALQGAGFDIGPVEDHREAILAMRDRAASRVDYERLLRVFGDRGRRLLDGIERLEAAIEAGDVCYVSLVARPTA